MISKLADFKALTPKTDEDAAFLEFASSRPEKDFLFWINFPVVDCDFPFQERKIFFVRDAPKFEFEFKSKEGVQFLVIDAVRFVLEEKFRHPRYNRFLFLRSSEWTFFSENALDVLSERKRILSKDLSVEHFNEAVQIIRLISSDFLSPEDVKRAHLSISEAFSFMDFSIDILSKSEPVYFDDERRPFYRDINSVFYEFESLLFEFQNRKEFCKRLYVNSSIKESSDWSGFFQFLKKIFLI